MLIRRLIPTIVALEGRKTSKNLWNLERGGEKTQRDSPRSAIIRSSPPPLPVRWIKFKSRPAILLPSSARNPRTEEE